jgi:hypothetical protein
MIGVRKLVRERAKALASVSKRGQFQKSGLRPFPGYAG